LVWWPTGSAGPFTARPYTLRVLAEHELVDMEPILQRAASATGVRVRFTYDDRAAASATVVSGAADREVDAVWLSSNRDIVRQNGGESRLGTETRIMNSPIVLGLKPDAANRLGWPNKQPTWADIAAAAGAHSFTFGMANPATSDAGLSALVAITS